MAVLLLTTALYPSVGAATCVTAPGSVTCSGSIPNGQSVTDDFGTITVNGLTEPVGGTGLRFTSSTDADIDVNADFTAFGIQLDPGFNRTRRAGFELRTDGSVTGTVAGDITGPTLDDVTNTPEFDLNNFGTFNVLSGTGIDLTRTGTINVTRPTVTATQNRRDNFAAPGGERDFVMGQFGAIRLRDRSGDINFVSTGDVSLDGGQRNLSVDRSAEVGVNQRVFSTRFASGSAGQSTNSAHFGVVIEGNADVTAVQNGDINLTGGGVSTSVETTGAIAATIATHSGGRGVFITDNDAGDVDQVSFLDQTTFTLNGDVTLTGADVEARAKANDVPGGSANTKATAQVDLSSQIGVWANKPSARDITVNGDIRVTNGTTIISAQAVDDAGQASGLVAVRGVGTGGSGFEGSAFLRDDTNTPKLSLNVTGDIIVAGGDVVADVTGTGTSTLNDLSDLPTGTPRETLTINRFGGSSATGLSLFATEVDYDLGGNITATGGNATGTMTGSDMNAVFNGGNATAMSFSAGSAIGGGAFNKVEDSLMNADGGDADLTLDGTNLEAEMRGGNSIGTNVSIGAVGQSGYTQTGAIAVTGGDARGTASAGSTISATGGSATGYSFNAGGRPEGAPETSTATIRSEGEITVTGGDATLTGDGTAIGGEATGIISFLTGADAPPLVEHDGIIRATGGAGITRQGAATGINISDFGFTSTASDGSTVDNDANILVTGDIYTDGTGVEDTLTGNELVSGSNGINAAVTGDAQVVVDGGLVDVRGSKSNGITVRAATSLTTLRNGTRVNVTADRGAGIALGTSQRVFENPSEVASVNRIVIDQTSAVITEAGIGIQDDGRTRVFDIDPDTNDAVPRNVDLGNQTTVDIAGTLSSGIGIAMDLGAGTDTLILRRTAAITGVSRLGAGDDRFIYQNFAETNAVDGGDGRDSVVVSVASGQNARFNPQSEIPNFTNFEAISKSGVGTLTVGGAAFANGPIDFEVLNGAGIVDSDQANLGVIVGAGAQFRTDNQVANILVRDQGVANGTGTASGLTNEGRFAPGNSIGTFTVTGDFAQTATGQLDIEIAADGGSDLVAVSGTATLDGTLSVQGIGYPTGFPDTQSYTILTANGGIAGAFANVTDNLPDVDVVAAYSANSVAISYSRGTMPGGPTTDMSDKSIHANALQAGLASVGFFSNHLRARGRAHGPSGAGRDTLAFAGLDGPVFSFADQTPGFTAETGALWLSPFASRADVDATAVATGYSADTNGLALGYEVTTPDGAGFVRKGIALGFSTTDVASGASSADIDTTQIGAYYHLERGPLRLTTAATFGSQSHDITRTIPIAGMAPAIARSSADGFAFEIGADLSYNLAQHYGWANADTLRVAPVVSLQHSVVKRDGYTETGAGILNLTVAPERYARTVLGVGMEYEQLFRGQNGMVIKPSLSVKYEHAFGAEAATVSSALAGVAGASFADRGAIVGDNTIAVGAGVEFQIKDNFSVDVRYSGRFSNSADTHTASISAVWKF
ncbi:autotransporter outer membrane beta-barrel domain-containing protein [uncultured Tateyamaria sp.]|uniref:autotransporter outer membrane beta-barrel domain-containing protein n=1 Tax=uncultured Tateyamaria sp. TaxID=455651 RepID=UPI002614BB7F|nr:autotransporter outer membrane beta-barrel domain-containing protein [uncultured Tateyamaria sp.]